MDNKNNFKTIPGGKKPAAKPAPNPAQIVSGRNKEIEKMFEEYNKNREPEKLMELFEKLRDTLLFVVGRNLEAGRFDMTRALVEMRKEGEDPVIFLGAYTSLEQVQAAKLAEGSPVTLLPFAAVCELLLNSKGDREIKGILINSRGSRFFVPRDFAQALLELEQERVKTGVKKPFTPPVKSTPEMPKVLNPEADKLLDQLVKIQDNTERTPLLNDLYHTIWKASVLVPAQMKDTKLFPLLFTEPDSQQYSLLAYTSSEGTKHAKKEVGTAMITFENAADMAVKIGQQSAQEEKKVIGLRLVGTSGASILFPTALLENFIKIEQQRKELLEKQKAPVTEEQLQTAMKSMRLTPQQKAATEHVMFELHNLPNKLFEQGQSLIDDIYARRETALDELFEASYTDIREYPYLEEEFALLTVSVREDLEILRVDFPERDQTAGCASRAYLVWNPIAGEAQYYAIVRQPEKNAKEHIYKINAAGEYKDLGETVIEGNELSHIAELADSGEK